MGMREGCQENVCVCVCLSVCVCLDVDYGMYSVNADIGAVPTSEK